MGKQKGRFGKGKYIRPKRSFHIKAKRDKGGTHLDLTIRLDEDEVKNILRPQIDRFLEELKRQVRAKQAKT
jgi:transcription initiation factor IIE alpha subunit